MPTTREHRLLFAADRMYDAIAALAAASTPHELAESLRQCIRAANNYDAAMSRSEDDDGDETLR